MRFPRIRLSIRLLMAFISILGCCLGWMVHSAHVQRDAVAAIVKAGGKVVYDWEIFADGLPNPKGKIWWPSWMVDSLGVDYFGTVRQAFILEREPKLDQEPTQVGRLGQLERLYLCSPNMTDAKLVSIAELTKLRGLSLEESKIGDAGLVHLIGLWRLEGLNLKKTQVTDTGLIYVKTLRNLKSVDLKETKVTDAGVQKLRQSCPNLIVYY